jgi:competence protein ComEC
MWLGTLAGVLGGDAARALDAVAQFPLAYLAWLGRTAAAVPHASLPVKLPGPLAAAAMYAAIGAASLARPLHRKVGRRAPRRSVLVAWLTAAVGVAVLLAPAPAKPPDGFVVSALDIGQGDAILLQHATHAVLFDAGPPGAPVVKRLRESGVSRLDALVITHSSADHGGGAKAVLDALPVALVLDGRKAPDEHEHGDGGDGGGERFEDVPANTPKAVTAAGQHVRAGPIDIEIVWPPPDASRAGDPNLTATVAIARDGGRSVLLTADAESDVLLPLDLPDVDVLKVSHHGSADDGLPALLEEIKPEAALISVGRGNTYGHPNPATIRALSVVGSVRRTDQDGTARVALR